MLRRAGETYEASELHARALSAARLVTYHTKEALPEQAPAIKDRPADQSQPEKPRRKRTYKRRDMRAED